MTLTTSEDVKLRNHIMQRILCKLMSVGTDVDVLSSFHMAECELLQWNNYILTLHTDNFQLKKKKIK